ncbi:MAG: Na+/H+ antiporter NhaC family protein, partial [Shewanella sp.]
CSPISDTTILSSTGACCHHIDHVVTQLPYALIAALISLTGYVVLGFTESVVAGLVACSVVFLISIIVLKIKSKGAIT